jgi:hypothetical protein
VSWAKLSKCRWRNSSGNEIVKYRMAGRWFYLLYVGGYKEYSDYKTFNSLKEAKLNGATK